MADQCSTCKWWDLSFEGNKPLRVGEGPRGQCLRALVAWDKDVRADTAMLTQDGSEYMAILMTLPTHVCGEYELGKP